MTQKCGPKHHEIKLCLRLKHSMKGSLLTFENQRQKTLIYCKRNFIEMNWSQERQLGYHFQWNTWMLCHYEIVTTVSLSWLGYLLLNWYWCSTFRRTVTQSVLTFYIESNWLSWWLSQFCLWFINVSVLKELEHCGKGQKN